MPVGAQVLAVLPIVERMLAGQGDALLPVPIDDPREKTVLTTALRVGEVIDDDVALVVSTSGTTGLPKGAMLSAAALTASALATHARLGGAGQWLLALPAHHIAGLQVLVRSVLSGTAPVVIDVSRGFDVAALPAAVAAMGHWNPGRRYASLVAVQLAKALADRAATAAMTELDAVLIGGGPLPGALAESASSAGIPVVRTYGMSETAGGCVYDGVPLDGVTVRADDGRVAIGGATLATGYRNPVDPDPFGEPGWFRTDDTGSLDRHGVLTVHGRLDDAISTGGLTVLPGIIEAAIAGHPAVAQCAVFGVPDDRLGQRVAAAVVVAPHQSPPTPADLRAHLARLVDATAAPRDVHIVEELPTRGIGKVDRRALARRFGGPG